MIKKKSKLKTKKNVTYDRSLLNTANNATNQSKAEFSFELFKDKLEKDTQNLFGLYRQRRGLTKKIEAIRKNKAILEKLVKEILSIEEKIDNASNMLDQLKSGNNLLKIKSVESNIEALRDNRVVLVKKYFNNMGPFREQAEQDFKKQNIRLKKFLPMHNLILQGMDQNMDKLGDDIYNLKLKKVMDFDSKMHNLYSEVTDEKQKAQLVAQTYQNLEKRILDGNFPEETKNLVKKQRIDLTRASSYSDVTSKYKNLLENVTFLTDVLDYRAKILTPEFIVSVVNKKANSLIKLKTEMQKDTELAKKLKSVIGPSSSSYTKSMLATREPINDFTEEVNKSLKNPEKYPPQLTLDRLQLKRFANQMKADILQNTMNAFARTADSMIMTKSLNLSYMS
jgi:hypothetical protein